MALPNWLHFFQRPFPSANMVLLGGKRPLLVDTGFGSEIAETEKLLREADLPPERLALVVNTHYHSDHVGGNHWLQTRWGVPIATHRWEAAMINSRDPESCSARWLDQLIEPYQVNQLLADGDEIAIGDATLQVLHTPGHTLGHISLYLPEEQVLIAGDTIHADDVAWVSYFREGAGALERAIETIERLRQLPVRVALSGHGPANEQFQTTTETALRRYEKWLGEPEKMGWHACKRIFAYKLMLLGGIAEAEVVPYLLQCQWFLDHSRSVFGLEPEAFAQPLLDEMLRSRAAAWRDGRLVALAPHTPPPPGWFVGKVMPGKWPKLTA